MAETVPLPAEGAGVFDLQIIATMLANGVQRICTFNAADFQIFAESNVVTPTRRRGVPRGAKSSS